METFLKSLRLGTLNFFGIGVPGFLLLFFGFVGFMVPVGLCLLDYVNSPVSQLIEIYNKNRIELIVIVIILSYVCGYILRLTTPDELDIKSGKKIIRHEGQDWPYTGRVDDKFPYYHYKLYLASRGQTELSELVKWGDPKEDPMLQPRSKTAVNQLKAQIAYYVPQFIPSIESNEAHVRLMSGLWMAIKYTRILCVSGLLAALFSSYLYYVGLCHFKYFPLIALFSTALVALMIWAEYKIVNLFHYRRVSELFSIVQAAYFARKKELELTKSPKSL
jgi:hypothetical protein